MLRIQRPRPLTLRLSSRSIDDLAGTGHGLPVRSQGSGNLPAALGEGALVLVRVLVTAERLGGVELSVAVRAEEEAGRLRLRRIRERVEAELKGPAPSPASPL